MDRPPPPPRPDRPPTVRVVGIGSVTAPADLMTANLAVEITRPTAADAMGEASRSTRVLLEALASTGVDAADATTTSIALYPAHDPNVYPAQTERITGYVATSELAVVIRTPPQAGAVLDAAATAVGDALRIRNVGFAIADPAHLMIAAREMAMSDAKGRAWQLATAAGTRLGKVLRIEEGADRSGPPMGRLMSAKATAMPVIAGSESVDVTVTVVFALEPL
ncbi:MAG: SIMPL domain-containing protein [Acidimicrobiia bacterium]